MREGGREREEMKRKERGGKTEKETGEKSEERNGKMGQRKTGRERERAPSPYCCRLVSPQRQVMLIILTVKNVLCGSDQ